MTEPAEQLDRTVNMQDPTDGEFQVALLIAEYEKDDGHAPLLRELAANLNGISRQAVHERVNGLRNKGIVETRFTGRERNCRLTPTGRRRLGIEAVKPDVSRATLTEP